MVKYSKGQKAGETIIICPVCGHESSSLEEFWTHRHLDTKTVDKVDGYLEVGHNQATKEVIINHPDLKPDSNGVGHIVFSPNQARNLAASLLQQAAMAEGDRRGPAPPNSKWWSVCSAHQQYQLECNTCNAGHWKNNEATWWSHKVWESDQDLWRKIANLEDAPGKRDLEDIFPGLRRKSEPKT